MLRTVGPYFSELKRGVPLFAWQGNRLPSARVETKGGAARRCHSGVIFSAGMGASLTSAGSAEAGRTMG
jgi:hypothetical protein